ncbi:MAG TPA: filament integrity protein FraC [Candidatus Sericytochromatia bacterium]|jgi:hypothetical protein
MKGMVLPLQTYLFQTLFLLVAIALEARVLQRRLYLTRRTSVEYATSINLLTTVIGWLAFFLVQNLLPQPIKDQIISYVFFDRFLSPQPESFNLMLISTGIVMFFSAFLIKLKGLQLLEAVLENAPQAQTSPESRSSVLFRNRRRRRLSQRLDEAVSNSDPDRATAVLLANAFSHSAIVLILVLRFFEQQFFRLT